MHIYLDFFYDLICPDYQSRHREMRNTDLYLLLLASVPTRYKTYLYIFYIWKSSKTAIFNTTHTHHISNLVRTRDLLIQSPPCCSWKNKNFQHQQQQSSGAAVRIMALVQTEWVKAPSVLLQDKNKAGSKSLLSQIYKSVLSTETQQKHIYNMIIIYIICIDKSIKLTL